VPTWLTAHQPLAVEYDSVVGAGGAPRHEMTAEPFPRVLAGLVAGKPVTAEVRRPAGASRATLYRSASWVVPHGGRDLLITPAHGSGRGAVSDFTALGCA
jgi:hypothetical protein